MLFFANAKDVGFLGDEEGLFDAVAGRVERVTIAKPTMAGQVCGSVHVAKVHIITSSGANFSFEKNWSRTALN